MLYQLSADNGAEFALLASLVYTGKRPSDVLERVKILDSTIWAVDKHGTRHVGQADVDKLTRVITAGIAYFVYIEELGMFAYYFANSCNPQREVGKWYQMHIVRFHVRDGITLYQAGFTLLDYECGVHNTESARADWDDLTAPMPPEVVTITIAGVKPAKLKEIRNHLEYALHDFSLNFKFVLG